MNKFRILKNGIVLGVFLGIFLSLNPMDAQAKSGSVTFGSESYSASENTAFPIGVYIRGEDGVGIYHVELQYDTSRLEYIGGGDSEKDGIITLEGTAIGNEVKYMVNFQAISGGDAGIQVTSAVVQDTAVNGGEQLDIPTTSQAHITVAGNDTSGTSFWDAVNTNKSSIGDIPVLGSLTGVDWC